jgi:hypothetical protein
MKWMDAPLEIKQLHHNSPWAVITEKSGLSFVHRLAELCFLFKLNPLHINLASMEKEEHTHIMARDCVKQANKALLKGYWMPNYQ